MQRREGEREKEGERGTDVSQVGNAAAQHLQRASAQHAHLSLPRLPGPAGPRLVGGGGARRQLKAGRRLVCALAMES